jgi:hypothetical protein
MSWRMGWLAGWVFCHLTTSLAWGEGDSGLERWFSPRGQDLAFLLSCIHVGLVRPSSSADLKQNKTRLLP